MNLSRSTPGVCYLLAKLSLDPLLNTVHDSLDVRFSQSGVGDLIGRPWTVTCNPGGLGGIAESRATDSEIDFHQT